mmetsp:Transcript_39708/g.45226  ORF Transcript_39708/g.45226 Transcript_39708/m.45226 type:complete len:222 (-) Transcript_39708:1065-1730(-)
MIFGINHKVAKNNGDFSTNDNHNQEYSNKESKQIVDMGSPHRRHDKVKLNEGNTKRQQTAHKQRKLRPDIKALRRNRSGNISRFTRIPDHIPLMSQIEPQTSQRQRTSQPHEQQHQNIQERHRRRRLFHPKHQINTKEHHKRHTGEPKRTKQNRLLPMLATKHLIQPRSNIPRQLTGKDKQHQATIDQITPLLTCREPYQRKRYQQGYHKEQLYTTACKNG